MDFNYLFTSFDGRINRQPYWIAVLILVGASIVITLLLAMVLGFTSPAMRWASLLLQLALLYPAAAVMAKRLHDRNRPTWWLAFMFVPIILQGLTNALGITGDPLDQNALDYLLGLVILVVAIWFLVELGFLRGTVGPNEFGPDPLETQI